MNIHTLSESTDAQKNQDAVFPSTTTEILSAMIQGIEASSIEKSTMLPTEPASPVSPQSEEEVSPHPRRHRPATSDRLLALRAEQCANPLKRRQRLPLLPRTSTKKSSEGGSK